MSDWTGMWITLTAQAEGNERDGFRIAHYWDGKKFSHKSEAVSNGFTTGRSDDFNVALTGGLGLAEIWWMDKRIEETPGTLAEISREIGLAR
jgi:hypothetical protein